jgi:hypothetical protein
VDEEAKYDVDLRHSSRYHKLSQWVEVLLCLSVAVAIGRFGMKVLAALHEENERLDQEALLEVAKELVGVGESELIQDDGKWAVDLLSNEQLLEGAGAEQQEQVEEHSAISEVETDARDEREVKESRGRRWWRWG